jgi:hypothetical protein
MHECSACSAMVLLRALEFVHIRVVYPVPCSAMAEVLGCNLDQAASWAYERGAELLAELHSNCTRRPLHTCMLGAL